MSAASSALKFSNILRALVAAGAFGMCLLAAVVWGQAPAADGAKPIAGPRQAVAPAGAVPTAREILGPAATVPLPEQPPAKIIVDPQLPDLLAKGAVVIQYRTENLRIMPVFGPAALAVSPRVGHIHVTVDDAPWVWGVWYGTNGSELVLGGLPPGPHKVLIELENPNHEPIAQGVVRFEVPRRSLTQPDPKAGGNRSALNSPKQAPPGEEPPAKIIVDPPQPDALARGLVLIPYRTENLQIVPVYGPAALAISPRIGHIHVTVDDGPWHWSDATGQPVVVNGLPPGPHKITFELVNANHETLAQEVVRFEVPRR